MLTSRGAGSITMAFGGVIIFMTGFITVLGKPQLVPQIPSLHQQLDPLGHSTVDDYFNYISDSTTSKEDDFSGLLDKQSSVKGSISDLPPGDAIMNKSDPANDAPNTPQYGYAASSPDLSADTLRDSIYPLGRGLSSILDSDWSNKQEVDPWQPRKRFSRPSRRRGPVMHRWQYIWGSPGKRPSTPDKITKLDTKRMVPYGSQIDSRLLNYLDEAN